MKNNLEKFIHILKEKKIKLCLAESISGGGLAYEMIKNKGASQIIDYSIVCYSDSSKREILGIEKHLKKYEFQIPIHSPEPTRSHNSKPLQKNPPRHDRIMYF